MGEVQPLLRQLIAEARAVSALLARYETDKSVLQPEDERSRYEALCAHLACLVGQIFIADQTFKQSFGTTASRSIPEAVRVFSTESRIGSRRRAAASNWLVSVAPGFQQIPIQDAEAAFEMACEIRSLLAANELLQERTLSDVVRSLGDRFDVQTRRLEQVEKSRLQRSVRNLLSHYCLFPWVATKEGTLAETHRILFSSAGIFKEIEMYDNVAGLDEILAKQEITNELQAKVKHILRGLQRATSEGLDIFGSFGDNDDRLPWPVRELGTGGEVMIIPSQGGKPGCASVLLAVAHSSKRGKLAPKDVMTKVQQTIIKCRGQLKIVIFFADPATHGSEVADHLPIIEDFITSKHFDLFIPVTIMGRRLNALEWN